MRYEKSDEPIVAMKLSQWNTELASQDAGGDYVEGKLDLAKGF